MTIVNGTSYLKRQITIRVAGGGTTKATIERIGDRQLARDGKYWAMVYATTLGGSPVSFACVHDGVPSWYRAPAATGRIDLARNVRDFAPNEHPARHGAS